MDVRTTPISDLLIFEPKAFSDDRGYFMETYNRERYRAAGVLPEFVQDNLSVSKKGVLRGLHFQLEPWGQGKLVQVVKGRALDVAVDLRVGSPTFGQHVAVELSADNKKQFWIPVGFAHGFVALDDETVFMYKCTNVYAKEHERGLRWNDPALNIAWGVQHPIVSEKDAAQPLLHDVKELFTYKRAP